MSDTYSVWHRNGQWGEYSQWYRDERGLSADEADSLADNLEKTSFQGWHSSVKVLLDGINPNP